MASLSAVVNTVVIAFIYAILSVYSLFGGKIRNPFYHRPSEEVEKEFIYRRDNWHHHYTIDENGCWRVEYVEKCPNEKK